ncbi:histidinol dehydrogenase [Conexibacter sp. JD483]|uniref:histidinol dehydrogenase n=1 Tax=unclassified Conexibacter TaxID=2627773 RepID=UPI002724D067|nr:MULTISPECIES: histidinol dehydrogenase [unclassified Conexibacter]MDO8189226.1 histidinol dehydrogenase [Conexibacter sp. CPCC 205706]MDO8201143.1 histidinol dehydrogenase [Conexibacter sp. CPCC 205762]MDR9372064.1 histidinol dehydrogenase [Conexibacter sp. JD483]
MRLERFTLAGLSHVDQLARELRALAPGGASVAEPVAAILADVRRRGDAAVVELTRTHDTGGVEPKPLRVSDAELQAALAALDPQVRAALEVAAQNIGVVAAVGLDEEREVTLGHGQTVRLREIPVRRAAVYVPGGRAPYPSTVLMGVVTAVTAGVEEVVLCAPPGPDGDVHPAILAAAALAGATEVYRMGGAQAIAALSYGTETVAPVDVIVGPGSLWVQEAKRQVQGAGLVGIDGFAGPSDLLVVLDVGADVRLAALDLRAQAEHGHDSLVVAVSPDESDLDALSDGLSLTPEPGIGALVQTADLEQALAVANAYAPEHLELIGPGAEALAPGVRNAGCLFVGRGGATAFGDYVAGSNHTLPTDGAARFASGLSARHFVRRMAEVRIPDQAASQLALAGIAIADAEGFTMHAESMAARMRENLDS